MKIGFDYPIFTLQHTGGVSRYFVRLVEQLLSLGEEVEVYAPLLINHYVAQLPRAVVRGWPVPFLPQKTARLLDVVNRCLTPLMAGNRRYDLVHETYYTTTPVMTNASARVTTIHDMIPERFPHFFSSRSRIWQRKQAAIQRADHIICVSQQTKMDLCDVYAVEPARITVIYLGVDTQWAAGASTAVQERPFLLYVGRRGRYKNFRGLLEAVARSRALRRELAVIAFGGGRFTAEERQLIRRLGLSEQQIKQVSGDDALLARYYRSATALVYPSLYEGFGLPPLEAMQNDCPVVVSQRGAIPEIVGAAGEYFDPEDPEDMARGIGRVVFDSRRRAELIAAGRERVAQFSWRRCAEQTRAVYQQVCQQKG
ncbi:MAG: glycosyltransferase family 1 protein [Gloeomargarita sp. GMQP_bins_120]